MKFPNLVYKNKGSHQRPGGTFSYIAVRDGEELKQALADGWYETLTEAIEVKQVLPVLPVIPKEEVSNAPPTRSEMEAKAKELGIKFDGRTGDAKLLTAINDALKK